MLKKEEFVHCGIQWCYYCGLAARDHSRDYRGRSGGEESTPR